MENETVSYAAASPHKCAIGMIRGCYATLARWAGPVTLSTFLLVMRIAFGWGFFEVGMGKLLHIDRPIGFFRQLGIPMPVANAWLVGCVECFGGLLLLIGLGSRAVSLVLIINMSIAYLAADRDALSSLFSGADPGKFIAAAEFWFFTTAVLIFALGPGWFSVDGILKCCGCRKSAAACKVV
jgi:putative oxidoreductase